MFYLGYEGNRERNEYIERRRCDTKSKHTQGQKKKHRPQKETSTQHLYTRPPKKINEHLVWVTRSTQNHDMKTDKGTIGENETKTHTELCIERPKHAYLHLFRAMSLLVQVSVF